MVMLVMLVRSPHKHWLKCHDQLTELINDMIIMVMASPHSPPLADIGARKKPAHWPALYCLS